MDVHITIEDELFDSVIPLRYSDVIDICIGHQFHVILFDKVSKKHPVVITNTMVKSVETFCHKKSEIQV